MKEGILQQELQVQPNGLDYVFDPRLEPSITPWVWSW